MNIDLMRSTKLLSLNFIHKCLLHSLVKLYSHLNQNDRGRAFYKSGEDIKKKRRKTEKKTIEVNLI